jgi:hypothetical protein
MNISRWWTESTPVLISKYAVLSGWRYPLVPVTGKLVHNVPMFFALMLRYHRFVHEDFDREVFIFAWWPIAPIARVCYWWKHSRWRFCVEHWMRGRVMDKPEGEAYTAWTWRMRPLRAWTWRKTRPVSSYGANRPEQEHT